MKGKNNYCKWVGYTKDGTAYKCIKREGHTGPCEIVQGIREEESEMRERKLYVWEGFCPDYTSGLAFAIAKTESDARRIVVETFGKEPWEWGELRVHSLDEKVGYAIVGGS